MLSKRQGLMVVALVSAGLFSGCGFHLKGQSGASAQMQAAAQDYWQMNPLQLEDEVLIGSPLRLAVRDMLESADIPQASTAKYRLLFDEPSILYRQTAQSAQGATTAETIRWQQEFSLQDVDGQVLSSGTLYTSRDRQVNPNALLAASSERSEILQDMADDIARQLLERLNAFVLRLELQTQSMVNQSN